MSIICICGSTKFKNEIDEANKNLTLGGYIVLAPSVFSHSGDIITEEQKKDLDKLHFEKIEMADEVLVVNPNGYIGESTRKEIEYANRCKKPIRFTDEASIMATWVESYPNSKGISEDYKGNGASFGTISRQADETYLWAAMISNPKYRYGSPFVEGLAPTIEGAKRIVESICQETFTCWPK